MTKKLSSKVKEDKIIQVMSGAPEGISPINIASHTELNENTVKSCLSKLKRIGLVKLKEGIRGLYVLVENNYHRDIFDFHFQNAILTCFLENCSKEFESRDLILFDGLIKGKLGISNNTKKATLHLSSPSGLEMPAILLVAKLFIDSVKTYTGLDTTYENITIATIEFNKDYYNLKLNGVNCITLDSLIAQYKLYEKKFGVREELKTKVPIQFPILHEMLIHGPMYVDISNKVEIQIKEMERIKQSIDKQNTAIDRIFDMIYKKLGAI